MGVIVAVALATVVVSLRLMAGPVDLGFLKPAVSQAFDTPAGKLTVDSDRIYAEWESIGKPIRVVFAGLRLTDAGGKQIATAPSVALSIDPRDILLGRLLPTAIVIDRATLDAEIDRQGGMLRRVMAKTDTASQGEVVALLIEELLAEPNHRSLIGQLDTVLVERAHVSFRDIESGVVWTTPDAIASLKRDESGVIISAGARFSRGGEPFDVSLSGVYGRDRAHISVEARIDGLKPLMFADFSPDVAILRGIDISLSGKLNVEADGAGNILSVATQVTGGKGTVALPGILPVILKVLSVNAAASVDAASHTAKIDHVDVDLGTVKLSVTGTGLRTEKGQSFSGRAEVRQIPIDHLGDYWPLTLAEGGRQWALANLSSGTLDVSAAFGLSAPGDDISQVQIDRTVAFLDYRGMKVHYMPHMPELEGVSGKAIYQDNSLHFDVTGGSAVGLSTASATVDLTNLVGPPEQQRAAIRIPVTGPARQAMAMLARPKLGLPKDSLFDPKRVGGDVTVDLSLGFPLLNTITVADLDVRAQASVSGLSLKNVLGDVDLTEGAGEVTYADDELKLSGHAKLDGSAAEIGWRQMFAPKAPFRQRYDLKGTFPSNLMVKAGFPSIEPFVTGPVGATISYRTRANGTAEVLGKFDLKEAKAVVNEIGWSKDAGTAAQLDVDLKFATGSKLASADFEGHGNGLLAKGQVLFDNADRARQISMHRLTVGRTDVTFEWNRGPDGVTMALRGPALELDRARRALRERQEMAAAKAEEAGVERRTRATIQLDQLLVQRGALGAVKGSAELLGERWISADFALGAGKGSAFKMTSNGDRTRSVALYVPDFGLLLANAGWLDGLVGGDLTFEGRFNDSAGDSPLEGKLKLGSYRMEKVAPRNDIDSLNSTIDSLARAGDSLQKFDSLEARLVKSGDRVDIKDGRSSGKSLGITFGGWLDLNSETARMRGVVVPAFALNNLLSNVPLLGPLLIGGKDSGLFAISYKLEGPFGDLKSDINMMSAITPGALRDLFTSQGETATPTPPQEKERTTP